MLVQILCLVFFSSVTFWLFALSACVPYSAFDSRNDCQGKSRLSAFCLRVRVLRGGGEGDDVLPAKAHPRVTVLLFMFVVDYVAQVGRGTSCTLFSYPKWTLSHQATQRFCPPPASPSEPSRYHPSAKFCDKILFHLYYWRHSILIRESQIPPPPPHPRSSTSPLPVPVSCLCLLFVSVYRL